MFCWQLLRVYTCVIHVSQENEGSPLCISSERYLYVCADRDRNDSISPCHAELMKMPRQLISVSQSDSFVKVVDINSHTE